MSPPVAQQIISSMRIIMGEDGSNEGKLLFLKNCYLLRTLIYPESSNQLHFYWIKDSMYILKLINITQIPDV